MAFYLDFEKKIEEIGKDLEVAKLRNDESAVSLYKKELENEINKTYKNLRKLLNSHLRFDEKISFITVCYFMGKTSKIAKKYLTPYNALEKLSFEANKRLTTIKNEA